MNNKFRFFAGLFLLCAAAALSAGGRKEKAVVIQITGRVRLVGSDLFSELVITSPDGEWYIAKEEKNKLNDLQNRTVTIEGVETVTEMKFVNGLSAGKRRELKNIKIISIQ
jgi:hypothetical protein